MTQNTSTTDTRHDLPAPDPQEEAAPVAVDLQTQDPQKELSPFRQRLAKHFADADDDFTSDDVAEKRACQWADEMEQQLARFTDTEGRLSQLLEQQPQVLSLLETMVDEGIPFRVAAKRILKAEGLQPQPGDDDFEEFAKQKAQAQETEKQLADNMAGSLKVLADFAREHGIGENEQLKLVEAINDDFEQLLLRNLTTDLLAGYRKRLNYDADVKTAHDLGELKGRNANIEARMVADQAAQVGDGLPQPTHGGYAPKMLKGQQPVIDFSKY